MGYKSRIRHTKGRPRESWEQLRPRFPLQKKITKTHFLEGLSMQKLEYRSVNELGVDVMELRRIFPACPHSFHSTWLVEYNLPPSRWCSPRLPPTATRQCTPHSCRASCYVRSTSSLTKIFFLPDHFFLSNSKSMLK